MYQLKCIVWQHDITHQTDIQMWYLTTEWCENDCD